MAFWDEEELGYRLLAIDVVHTVTQDPLTVLTGCTDCVAPATGVDVVATLPPLPPEATVDTALELRLGLLT